MDKSVKENKMKYVNKSGKYVNKTELFIFCQNLPAVENNLLPLQAG